MFERPQSGERAILLHASPGGVPEINEREEFAELAVSAGAVVVDELVSARRKPDSRYFIGKGKLADVKKSVDRNRAELIISSAPLTPSQERNLERSLSCRVLDRAGLILDIFAQRARSFEGKLQVELAQLRHLSTRLVAAGPTSSGKRAASDFAARARRSSRRTDASLASGFDN